MHAQGTPAPRPPWGGGPAGGRVHAHRADGGRPDHRHPHRDRHPDLPRRPLKGPGPRAAVAGAGGGGRGATWAAVGLGLLPAALAVAYSLLYTRAIGLTYRVVHDPR